MCIRDSPGGYTRIIKTGNRLGDNAEMCFIELVDYLSLIHILQSSVALKYLLNRLLTVLVLLLAVQCVPYWKVLV